MHLTFYSSLRVYACFAFKKHTGAYKFEFLALIHRKLCTEVKLQACNLKVRVTENYKRRRDLSAAEPQHKPRPSPSQSLHIHHQYYHNIISKRITDVDETSFTMSQ